MSDDAQRNLEKKALRNVRGLVDRMEGEEQASRRSQRHVLYILAAAVVAVVVVAAVVLMPKKGDDAKAITVAPGKK